MQNLVIAAAHWVAAHFGRYRSRSRWSYFWRVAVESIVLSRVVIFVADRFGLFPKPQPFHFHGAGKYLLIALVIGPMLELIAWQWLPVWVARRFGVGFWGQVLASFVLFFPPHLGNGLRSAIGGGFIGGFYIVFTYVRWREQSQWTAFYMTYAQHATDNLIQIFLWWLLTS
jgi:hypothetical protein